MDEGEAFIRQAAAARGIDAEIALRVADSEGGRAAPGLIGRFATGWSFWQYQLHYGGPDYPQFGTVAGMGVGFTELTGWQPGDPRAWRDACRYALNRARLAGWGAWYGAAAVGIGRWDGIQRGYPFDGNAEIWDYERPQEPPMTELLRTTDDAVRIRQSPTVDSAIVATLPQGAIVEPLDGRAWRLVRYRANANLGTPTYQGWTAADFLEPAPSEPAPIVPGYDQSTPVWVQDHDWDCAEEAANWALRSLGRKPSDAWLERALLDAGVESEQQGLLDHTGRALADFITRTYDPDIRAYAIPEASFAQVATLAPRWPVLIGGVHWGPEGHWSAVRGFDGELLLLANPGGSGPTYGQQFLDRARWDERAPWSAVVLERKAA